MVQFPYIWVQVTAPAGSADEGSPAICSFEGRGCGFDVGVQSITGIGSKFFRFYVLRRCWSAGTWNRVLRRFIDTCSVRRFVNDTCFGSIFSHGYFDIFSHGYRIWSSDLISALNSVPVLFRVVNSVFANFEIFCDTPPWKVRSYRILVYTLYQSNSRLRNFGINLLPCWSECFIREWTGHKFRD